MAEKKYWFRKRKGMFTKDMGYGYIPVSWEGWLMIVLLLAAVSSAACLLDIMRAGAKEGLLFFAAVIIALSAFAYISQKKTRP